MAPETPSMEKHCPRGHYHHVKRLRRTAILRCLFCNEVSLTSYYHTITLLVISLHLLLLFSFCMTQFIPRIVTGLIDKEATF